MRLSIAWPATWRDAGRPRKARRNRRGRARRVERRARLPETGADAGALLDTAASLLFEHSVSTAIPGFLATSRPVRRRSACSAILSRRRRPELRRVMLSPMATEIEAQTVRWIGRTDRILIRGSRLARSAGQRRQHGELRVPACREDRESGMGRAKDQHQRQPSPADVYASSETHTWVERAADLFGFGTNAIRWIPVDERQRLKTVDCAGRWNWTSMRGDRPFLVVGTAGSVSTGAIDPLPEMATIAASTIYGLRGWRVPGARSRAADAADDLRGLSQADSVAVDAYKWLYAPLEAGCASSSGPAISETRFGIPALLPLR